MPGALQLTGHSLTRRDFYQVVLENRRVRLSPEARGAMTQSRRFIEKIIRGKRGCLWGYDRRGKPLHGAY